MIKVDLRVSKEVHKQVTSMSKERGISFAETWRIVIEKGLNSSDSMPNRNDILFKLAIQNLTLCQRIADHLKDDLIDLAKADAREILKAHEEKV